MAAATGVVQGHQAADCHVHVFDPRYAYAPNPRYEPEPFVRGTAADFTAVLDAHGITHALLLAAEPYRDDNRPVLDAIAASGGRFKGIALVGDPLPDEAALRRLADAGIVGIRFNLAAGTAILQAPGVPRLLAQMREMGWFLDLHTIGDDLAQALPHLPAEGPRLLIDHVARPDVARRMCLFWGVAPVETDAVAWAPKELLAFVTTLGRDQKLLDSGSKLVLVGSSDMGQGVLSGFAQVVGDEGARVLGRIRARESHIEERDARLADRHILAFHPGTSRREPLIHRPPRRSITASRVC